MHVTLTLDKPCDSIMVDKYDKATHDYSTNDFFRFTCLKHKITVQCMGNKALDYVREQSMLNP